MGAWWYGRLSPDPAAPDPLQQTRPDIFSVLENKFYLDEVYEATIVRGHAAWARACNWADFWIWNSLMLATMFATLGLAWCSRVFDEYGLNFSFDRLCSGLREGGGWTSRWQNGRVQFYLRFIGVGVAVLCLLLIWGCRA